MENNSSFDWRSALVQTWNEVAEQFIVFIPQLFLALFLLLAGWLAARLLAGLTLRLITRLDTLLRRLPSIRRWLPHGPPVGEGYAVLASRVVFWSVMLFFVAASTTALGWDMFSNWMAGLVAHLPNIITGLLIIFIGYLLSNVAQLATLTATQSAGVSNYQVPAILVKVVVFVTALIMGIQQAGINVGFLANVLVVTLGAALAGGALAFGLGARDLIANIIGIQQLRKHVQLGDRIEIGDVTGVLVEMTQTELVLDTSAGRVLVPAQQFNSMRMRLISQASPAAESSGER